MRLMLGLVGIASVSALTAAMVPSIAPAQAADTVAVPAAAVDVAAAQPAPTAAVQHVTRYVTLQPGQTPPPGAAIKAQPTPTPIVKVKIVTRSRQSGQP